MPSPTDSSRSLTGRSSRSLTHLRLQRTWLQVLLVLGLVQAILGVLIVTFSLVAATITPSTKIRHSCPSWAGFSVSVGPGQRGEGAALLPGPQRAAGPRGGQPRCSPTPCPWLPRCIMGRSHGLPQGDSEGWGPPSAAGNCPGYAATGREGCWGTTVTTGQGPGGGRGSALSAVYWGEGMGYPMASLQHRFRPGFAAQPEQPAVPRP